VHELPSKRKNEDLKHAELQNAIRNETRRLDAYAHEFDIDVGSFMNPFSSTSRIISILVT